MDRQQRRLALIETQRSRGISTRPADPASDVTPPRQPTGRCGPDFYGVSRPDDLRDDVAVQATRTAVQLMCSQRQTTSATFSRKSARMVIVFFGRKGAEIATLNDVTDEFSRRSSVPDDDAGPEPWSDPQVRAARSGRKPGTPHVGGAPRERPDPSRSASHRRENGPKQQTDAQSRARPGRIHRRAKGIPTCRGELARILSLR